MAIASTAASFSTSAADVIGSRVCRASACGFIPLIHPRGPAPRSAVRKECSMHDAECPMRNVEHWALSIESLNEAD
jgi:hypothetical protein